MYQAKFMMEGFTVVTAEDGDKGIAAATSETPDIILLDILMPNVNGFEVLRQLKTQPETKNIPVVVYTNLGTSDADEKRELAFSLGASDYLVKALHEPESIVERINAILKPKASGEVEAAA
jgi:DNA-binding response OmpR family regulator